MDSQPIRVMPYIRWVTVLVPVTIAVNKLVVRPWVHTHADLSFLIILVNSLPNFIEAVIGTIILSGIGLVLRARFTSKGAMLKDRTVYSVAALLASVYVITQELNLHRLGGDNVYDPYDIGASIIGLLFTYVILNTFGMLRESSSASERNV